MGRAALSTGLAGISGTVGDLVFEQRAGGAVVRPRSTAPPRRTEGSQTGERRLTWVAVAWHALDEASFAAWTAFADAQAVRNPATGAWVAPRAYNLFCRYAGKVRQVDSTASLEGFRPPATPFGGDGVIVDCGASIVEGRPDPAAIHDPQSTMLVFSADRANAEGVVTEILTQPLANARRRAYPDRYVARGFVAFTGPGTFEAPCEAGAYACAYRFVRRATGQTTAIFELGVVAVGR